MDIKSLLSSVFGICAAVSFATEVPVVTVTSFTQADDRTVTVKYTLENAPAVVTMDVETNGPNGWVSIGGKAICGTYGAAPTGDVWKKIAQDGSDYTITWHPDLTWADHKITDNGARVVVTAWALDNTPDYMAINLALSGDDAIRYYPGAEYVPGGVLGNKSYRTTSLLMRKIMAKGVTYTMGASATEVGYNGAKEDFREVDLANNFYIGVFEVTQAQWSEVNGEPNDCFFTADPLMRPVESITYGDIRGNNAYLYPLAPGGWIGKLNSAFPGFDFDLPNETQWEWACRAGNPLGYWGNGSPITIKDLCPNCPGRYKSGYCSATDRTAITPHEQVAADTDPRKGGTAICGSYEPNSWGLYDMHGNVWEYTNDWHTENVEALKPFRGATNADGSEMLIDGTGSKRHLRGGSYSYAANFCRSATRHTSELATKRNYVGFRLICRGGLK
jgi:formylglycine-generating enzyme required for sulfatase activity